MGGSVHKVPALREIVLRVRGCVLRPAECEWTGKCGPLCPSHQTARLGRLGHERVRCEVDVAVR